MIVFWTGAMIFYEIAAFDPNHRLQSNVAPRLLFCRSLPGWRRELMVWVVNARVSI
jgi:hypothetical protein